VRFRVLLEFSASPARCFVLRLGSGPSGRCWSEAVESKAKHPGGGSPAGASKAPADRPALGSDLRLDLYHHAIDVFTTPLAANRASYQSQIAFRPLDRPLPAAASSSGALYANDWPRGVARVLPSPLSFDQAESTAWRRSKPRNVYVDDRTYVAVYEPSGAPVFKKACAEDRRGHPHRRLRPRRLRGKVYVPDAATKTINVYEPASTSQTPPSPSTAPPLPRKASTPSSDAAVGDRPDQRPPPGPRQPAARLERPEAAIDEFDSTGTFWANSPKR